MTLILLLVGGLLLTAGCTTGGRGPSGNLSVQGSNMTLMSVGKAYPAYLAEPVTTGKYPGIVMIHSFNGLEPGYRALANQLAGEGYVVIAPEWQTYNPRAGDDEVTGLVRSAVALLGGHQDVDASRLGLTGFCAGGRFTMLLLPQIKEFESGVAFYGFPYSTGYANNTTPASHVSELNQPMLIIHGTRDQASNITDIYRYAGELDVAEKYFEMKVYQGEPHGFMVVNGSLSTSFAAQNAYREMADFFDRTLLGDRIT